MSQLEDDLRRSLERVEPPAGFADKVVARTATPSGTVVRLGPARRRSWVLWVGAAAAAAVVAVGAWGFTTRRPEPIETLGSEVASAPVAPTVLPPSVPIASEVPRPVDPDLDVGRGNAGPTGGWSRRVRTARDAAHPAAGDPTAQAEAQRATEQLRIALNITSNKLSAVRRAAQTKITIPAS